MIGDFGTAIHAGVKAPRTTQAGVPSPGCVNVSGKHQATNRKFSDCRGDIGIAHFHRACELEGIDALGLGPVEQAYMRAVAEGSNRLNVIASRLGLPTRTVAEVCEPFLIRVGFLVKDDQGRRQLSAEGREHLSGSGPASG